jgi:4-hydroxybenzoate polyprenyltransferase
MFPANYWIYSVNDIADYDTDKHNPKKQGYELLLRPTEHKKTWATALITTLPFLAVSIFSGNPWWTLATITGFLFFGSFYSLPPIRAKAIPFLDSAFNILYLFPGLVGYSLVSSGIPSLQVVFAGTAWCMAMHAFSAIPDIRADKDAGLRTVATTLGATGTLAFCALLYLSATIAMTTSMIGLVTTALGSCYLAIMVIAYSTYRSSNQIFSVYRVFPLINTLAGAVLTFSLLNLRP